MFAMRWGARRYGPGVRDHLKHQCVKLLHTLVLQDQHFEEMLVNMDVGLALHLVSSDHLAIPALRVAACELYQVS